MEDEIRIFGTTGKEGKGESYFAQPRGICMDQKTKEIFVVDCNNHRVQVFHLNSMSFIRQIGKGTQGNVSGSLNYAVGICMDDKNQIFVADTNNHRIVVFNHITGCHVRSIGSQGTANGLFNSPYGVAVDNSSSLLYVADYDNHRVQVFHKDSGDFVRVLGLGLGRQRGQLNQPIVVCLDPAHNHIYVADYSNNRVQALDINTGEFYRSVGAQSGPDALNGPRGVCISEESDLLFIADRENHRIQIFVKSTGILLRHLGNGSGVLLGQFYRPMEMCVATGDGLLLVVDGYNHRVQAIPLPELQRERDRLRAIASHKLQMRLRRGQSASPKASAMAVGASASVPVHVDAVMLDDPTNLRRARLHFPKYGFLYDMCIPREEALCFMQAHFQEQASTSFCESTISLEMNSLKGAASKRNGQLGLLSRQAESFLSVLSSLAECEMNCAGEDAQQTADVECNAFVLIPPALCALYSLIQRGWMPEQLPSPVVVLLVDFLSQVGCNVQSASLAVGSIAETQRVVDAIVSVLSAVSRISAEASRLVLMQVVQRIGATPCGMGSQRGFYQYHRILLLAHLEIIACVLRNESVQKCSAGFAVSSNRRDEAECRDVMSLILGSSVVSILTAPVRPTPGGKTVTPLESEADVLVPTELSRLIDLVFHINTLRDQPVTAFSESLLSDLQLDLLQNASKHVEKVLQIDANQQANCSVSAPRKRSRGGRNIWLGGDAPLAAGDLVDALDKEKCWFESMVMELLPDGGVRVHFLGWGAKWDDVVLAEDRETRLAPLNTQTKNWRGDLFVGGLIEIKCNEDQVNQKWMWGKVAALHVEESWIEVAYSFSNEPLVTKRAWLYGETICPVGMHTKDKSKSAAALLVKPLKKMEDLLRERGLDEEDGPTSSREGAGSESVFFDPEDDLDDEAPPSAFSATTISVSLCDEGHSRQLDTHLGSAKAVAHTFFDCIMREVLLVVTRCADSQAESPSGKDSLKLAAVGSLLGAISKSAHQTVLLRYFLQPILFQSGMRAKLISGATVRSNSFSDSSDLCRGFQPIVDLLHRLQRLCDSVCNVLRWCLAGAISSQAMEHTASRVAVTINRCGATHMATELIAAMLVRRTLAHLLRTVSRREVAQITTLFQGSLLSAKIKQLPLRNTNDIPGAFRLVKSLIGHFMGGRSVSLLEMDGSVLCRLAPERDLSAAIALLSSEQLYAVSAALATTVNELLRSELEDTSLDGGRTAFLESVYRFIQVAVTERMHHHFAVRYECVLASRLLSGQFSSLTSELAALNALPCLLKARQMVNDLQLSTAVAEGFHSYLTTRMDDWLLAEEQGEVTEGPHPSMVDLVLRRRGFGVRILGCAHWPLRNASMQFSSLRLPCAMAATAREFSDFFCNSRQNSGPTPIGRKFLHWCFSLGTVTLNCLLYDGSHREIEVSEAQCVVLMAFNAGAKSLSVRHLCDQSNLSLEEMRSVLSSLTLCEEPVLELLPPVTELSSADSSVGSRFHSSSRVQLSRVFLSFDGLAASEEESDIVVPLKSYNALTASPNLVSDTDWRQQLVDACIVRVLKQADRDDTGDFNCTVLRGAVSADRLVSLVWTCFKTQNAASHISSSEVLTRCEQLSVVGVVERIQGDAQQLCVAYCYVHSAVVSACRPEQTASRPLLFEQLLTVIGGVEMTAAIGEDADASSCGECKESGGSKPDNRAEQDSPAMRISQQLFVHGLAKWLCDAPLVARDVHGKGLMGCIALLTGSVATVQSVGVLQVVKLLHQRDLNILASSLSLDGARFLQLNRPPPPSVDHVLGAVAMPRTQDPIVVSRCLRAVFLSLSGETSSRIVALFVEFVERGTEAHTRSSPSFQAAVMRLRSTLTSESSRERLTGLGAVWDAPFSLSTQMLRRSCADQCLLTALLSAAEAAASRQWMVDSGNEAGRADCKQAEDDVNCKEEAVLSLSLFVQACAQVADDLTGGESLVECIASQPLSWTGGQLWPSAIDGGAVSWLSSGVSHSSKSGGALGAAASRVVHSQDSESSHMSWSRVESTPLRTNIPLSLGFSAFPTAGSSPGMDHLSSAHNSQGSFSPAWLLHGGDQAAAAPLEHSYPDDEVAAHFSLESMLPLQGAHHGSLAWKSVSHINSAGALTLSNSGHSLRAVFLMCCERLEQQLGLFCGSLHQSLWGIDSEGSVRHSASCDARSADSAYHIECMCRLLLNVDERPVAVSVCGAVGSVAASSMVDWLQGETAVNQLGTVFQSVLTRAFHVLDSDGDGLLEESDLCGVHEDLAASSGAALHHLAAGQSDWTIAVLTRWTTAESSEDFHEVVSRSWFREYILSVHAAVMTSSGSAASAYEVATMLAHYAWDRDSFLEDWFADPTAVRHRCGVVRCQYTSRFVFSHAARRSEEERLVLCSQCQSPTASAELWSLPCLHFACSECWSQHISASLATGATPSHLRCWAVSRQSCVGACVAHVDFVETVCGKGAAENVVRSRMTRFFEDFADTFEHRSSAKMQYWQLIETCDQRSDCMQMCTACEAFSGGNIAGKCCVSQQNLRYSPDAAEVPHSTAVEFDFAAKYLKLLDGNYLESPHNARKNAAECVQKLAETLSESEHLYELRKLRVWNALQVACTLVEHLIHWSGAPSHNSHGSESFGRPPINRSLGENSERCGLTVESLTESLVPLLVSVTLKMRNKWTSPAALSSGRTSKVLSSLRVFVSQILSCITAESASREAAPLVESTGRLLGLLHVPPEPWMSFDAAPQLPPTSSSLLSVSVACTDITTVNVDSMDCESCLATLESIDAYSSTGVCADVNRAGAASLVLKVIARFIDIAAVCRGAFTTLSTLLRSDPAASWGVLQDPSHSLWALVCASLAEHGSSNAEVVVSCCALVRSVMLASADIRSAATAQLDFCPLLSLLADSLLMEPSHPLFDSVVGAVATAVTGCLHRNMSPTGHFLASAVHTRYFPRLRQAVTVLESSADGARLVPQLKMQLAMGVVQLTRGGGNRLVQEYLSREPSVCEALVDFLLGTFAAEGGLKADESEVLNFTLSAICELVSGCRTAQTQVGVVLQGSHALLEVLQRSSPDDLPLQSLVLQTLISLATGSAEVQEVLQSLGAVHLLFGKRSEAERLLQRCGDAAAVEVRSILGMLLLRYKHALLALGFRAAPLRQQQSSADDWE